MNKWTLALAVAGLVSMAAVASAEEAENQALTAVSGTTISGYVDTSMNWQFGDKKTSTGRSNDGAGTQNGFNLNAVKISVSKALEEDASTWAAGYRADLLFGEDANMYSQTFIKNKGNTSNNFALQNAYVDLRTPIGNGLDFRFGVFESIVGYESADSYLNPNFSRSYGYYIQPRQHTGGLLSYNFDLNDWTLGLRAGIANTYDSAEINGRGSDSARFSYMGAVNLIFPESTGFLEGTEIYVGAVNGIDSTDKPSTYDTGWDTANVVNLYAGITMPLPVTGLRFGFSYDYRDQRRRNDTDHDWAQAAALYLAYSVTEKLTLANRFEYANGRPGTWGCLGDLSDDPTKRDEYLSDAFTVSYKLWENVLTRAEFRWDYDMSNNKRMVTTHDRDNAFGITGNIVYVF